MKKNLLEFKEMIIHYINKNRKLSAIILAISLVLVIGLILYIPKAQANIRASEIQSLVAEEPLTKKAIFLDSKTADQEISEKTAITVLFATPSGKTYDEIIAILKNKTKMNEFTHSIYIYPMVYNMKKIEDTYHVDGTEPTVIFFEKGKEKNRLTINSTEDMASMLIPALNQLPLASVDQATQATGTNASGQTSPVTSSSQSSEATQSTTETVPTNETTSSSVEAQ